MELEPAEGGRIRRPRVDVLIQTSSILRDLVPHFAVLLDEAASLAGELDEPEEWNYIRKHTLENIRGLRTELALDPLWCVDVIERFLAPFPERVIRRNR